MPKKKNSGRSKKPEKKKQSRKERLEKIGKKLAEIDKQLEQIERDLAKTREDEEGLVEEDMRQRQKKIPSKKYTTDTPRSEFPEEDKTTGVGLFYRKFTTKVRKALK
jgi:hypothetical protein